MGYIYVVRHGDTNKYKIGIARNLEDRITQLQTGNPEKLTLEATFKTNECVAVERLLHKALYRYNISNEWFEVDFSIIRRKLEIIQELLIDALDESDADDIGEIDDGKGPYFCKYCDKQYMSIKALNGHQGAHRDSDKVA